MAWEEDNPNVIGGFHYVYGQFIDQLNNDILGLESSPQAAHQKPNLLQRTLAFEKLAIGIAVTGLSIATMKVRNFRKSN
jgi:hypothetical protein